MNNISQPVLIHSYKELSVIPIYSFYVRLQAVIFDSLFASVIREKTSAKSWYILFSVRVSDKREDLCYKLVYFILCSRQ